MEEDYRGVEENRRLPRQHHQHPPQLPPGYRFVPTDEELLKYYLHVKVAGRRRLPHDGIIEIDLYKYPPQLLTVMQMELCEGVWYFFTRRNRKYPKGNRPNRAAGGEEIEGSGYWKPTNSDKMILTPETGKVLGYKRSLDFYVGKPPFGVRTDWKMTEYRTTKTTSLPTPNDPMLLDEWILCKIYYNLRAKKNDGNISHDSVAISGAVALEPAMSRQFLSTQNGASNFIVNNGPAPEPLQHQQLLPFQNSSLQLQPINTMDFESMLTDLDFSIISSP